MKSQQQEPRGATGEDERATIKLCALCGEWPAQLDKLGQCENCLRGIKSYLSEIGRKGGQKSRRKLTKSQARAMVRARTAKRAALRPNDGTQ